VIFGIGSELGDRIRCAAKTMRIAYLVGTYPAVSHTFISREIAGLRKLGVEIQTFSVRRPPPDQLLTDEDRRSAEETPTIQPPRPRTVLRAHVQALTRSPSRYLETLSLAVRLSPGGVRATTWHLFYFAEALVLCDWLRQRGIKHVHVHFANAATSIAMLYAHYAQVDGATWSFTMHGPTEFDNVESFLLAEKVRRSRFVVCISDYARSQLMKLTPPEQWSKLHVIRCGIDPTTFRAERRRSRPGTDRITLLCVGRLVPEKGHSLLIGALGALPAAAAERVRLVIVGDGPERARLEQRAAEVDGHIIFTGAVGQDRIPGLYADADVFCLPSFAEGLPVVLMEAMAMGLPVIATRVMGIPELVTDRRCGLVVSPGRSDEFARAIEELLDDENLRHRLGEAARERVIADYDIRASVIALQNLYRSQVGF
jgi:colanic acid/amylovoran biosynthesis glycosyltransferase